MAHPMGIAYGAGGRDGQQLHVWGLGYMQFLFRRASLTLRLGQMRPSNAEKIKKLYSDISKKLTYSFITTYIKYAYIVYNMCMCVLEF